MSELVGARAPGWLRIVAALGLVWNLFGVYQYLMTVGVVAGADAAAVAAMPAWVTGAFAVAVFGGALGCVGLLMLKGWSKLLLLRFAAGRAGDGCLDVRPERVGRHDAQRGDGSDRLRGGHRGPARLAVLFGGQEGLAQLKQASGGYISPRARRMAYQRATLELCCCSVSAKTWPPVPSATKNKRSRRLGIEHRGDRSRARDWRSARSAGRRVA